MTKEAAQATPDPELDKIVALAQVVRAQIEAQELANRGKFDQAAQLMGSTTQHLTRRGHGRQAQIAESLGHSVSSRSLYAESAGYRTSMRQGATRAYGASNMDGDAQVLLAACDVSIGNASMTQSAAIFTETVTVGPSVSLTDQHVPLPTVVLLNPKDPTPST